MSNSEQFPTTADITRFRATGVEFIFPGHQTTSKEISFLQVSKHSDDETEELLDHYYVMPW